MNIIQGYPIPKKNYYKVYVRSCTFNQAPYIEDCLNGVAMQETNFPFVHHVIDDASTDGEQEVLKTWMKKNCDMEHAEYYDNELCTITLVKNNKNSNCTLAAYFLKKNMYKDRQKDELYASWRDACPYEAICEGDDYWIDNKKLENQITILDNNPKCVMVYTDFTNVDENGVLITRKYHDTLSNKSKSGYLFPSLIWENYIMTLTACFRTYSLRNSLFKNNILFLDYKLFMCLSLLGDIMYIPDKTGCYRRLNTGAVATMGDRLLSMIDDIRLFTIDYFLENKNKYSIGKRVQTYWAINKSIFRKTINRRDEFMTFLKKYPVLLLFSLPVIVAKIISRIRL